MISIYLEKNQPLRQFRSCRYNNKGQDLLLLLLQGQLVLGPAGTFHLL